MVADVLTVRALKYFLEAWNEKGDNKKEFFFTLNITRNVHHKSSDLRKKKLCLNEVRQSVITHEITDSKVLSHKKAHKERYSEREKATRKNYEYYVLYWSFPFQILWQISSGKRKKRVGENLVRRLEWWTHRIMINLAFMKKIYTISYSERKEKRWEAVRGYNKKEL